MLNKSEPSCLLEMVLSIITTAIHITGIVVSNQHKILIFLATIFFEMSVYAQPEQMN